MSSPRQNAPSQYASAPLDQPREKRPGFFSRFRPNPDSFGQFTEATARWMGTPQFLMWMTVFVAVWLSWNTLAPESIQFDPRSLNFTLLTLMLSLQASYAAPLLLLAQNRQDDRDRVVAEEDRKRGQQNLADTEYLTREIASLRIAVREVATRDYVRSELRGLLEEILEAQDQRAAGTAPDAPQAGPESARRSSSGRKSERKSDRKSERGKRQGPRETVPADPPAGPGAGSHTATAETRTAGHAADPGTATSPAPVERPAAPGEGPQR